MIDREHRQADDEERIQAFVSSACAGDIKAMRCHVAGGFDLNATDRFGDTILERVIGDLEFSPPTPKYRVIQEMLRLGADVRGLSEDGSSPLFIAVLNMDTEMVRILLDAGADPNTATMYARDESLYDWAGFVYRYEVWNGRLPEGVTAASRTDTDAWLRRLDRLAVKYGKRRPDHLRLLRQRGALSMCELRENGESAPVHARHGQRSIERLEPRRRSTQGKHPVSSGQDQRVGRR
jgi:ankyrin repeat protein